MFLIIALLTGVSVQAQKKNGVKISAAPTPQTVVIQDSAGEGFMIFDLSTGAYKCKLCEYDYSFSGLGSVKSDGCLLYFTGRGDGYTISAYVSLCEQVAKCFIDVTKINGRDIEPFSEALSDPDLRDSQTTCTALGPAPIDVPSEIVLQNDADGSFLLLVTSTGDFKFVHCADDIAMSGTGRVTIDGPWLNFEVINPDYRVVASVNLEAKTGKAAIDLFSAVAPIAPVVISDNNFLDNVPVCGAKK